MNSRKEYTRVICVWNWFVWELYRYNKGDRSWKVRFECFCSCLKKRCQKLQKQAVYHSTISKSSYQWVFCMEVDKNGDENETAQILKTGTIQWLWRKIHGKRNGKLTFFKNGVKNRIMTYECFRHDISCELINDERATNACCWRRCKYAVLWSIKDRMIMLSWEELDGEWNMMRV